MYHGKVIIKFGRKQPSTLKDVYDKVTHELRKHDRHDLKEKLKQEWYHSSGNRIELLKKYAILPQLNL